MNCIEKEYKSIVTRLGLSLLFFLFLFNLLSGGAQTISLILREFNSESDTVYILTDLMESAAYLVSFILPVPFFYFISQNKKKHPMELSLIMPTPYPAIKLAAIVVAGMAVIIPIAYLNSLLFPISYDTTSELFSFDFSKPYKVVLCFISTALVPAFAEELLFRGLIISNIKPYGKNSAVLISAVAFGLMHQNPAQILYAMAAGIVFGLIYVETDSIWCCIVLHFMNNLTSVIQNYLLYILNEEAANTILFFVDITVIAIGSICAIALLNSLKKKRGDKNIGVYGSFEAEAQTEARINTLKNGFSTPAFMLFLILCSVQCVINGVMLWFM